MTCEQTLAAGAYVLDALDTGERTEFEAHLTTCPSCRVEVAELAGLPAVLARTSLADVDGARPVPPDDALDRLLRRAAQEQAAQEQAAQEQATRDQTASRRHRHVRQGLWAAAAAAVLVAGGVGVVVSGVVDGAAGGGSSHVVTLAGTGAGTAVQLEVRLRPTEHGTELAAHVDGVPPGERCRLLAVDRSGRTEVAATWTATYAGTAAVTGSTSVRVDDLDAVRVVADDGTLLAVATAG
jgi:anti-sigma factor RsiW